MLVMLQEELDVLKLKQKIQQKVKVNIDKKSERICAARADQSDP